MRLASVMNQPTAHVIRTTTGASGARVGMACPTTIVATQPRFDETSMLQVLVGLRPVNAHAATVGRRSSTGTISLSNY